MGEKKYANDPVLFISQPELTMPKVQMQHQYMTMKKKSLKNNTAPLENEDTLQENTSENKNERKLFKEMTVEERIQYFLNTHSYSPKLRCEIKTKDRTYQGIVADYKDGKVYMQVGRRSSNAVIPLENITKVRMLGF